MRMDPKGHLYPPLDICDDFFQVIRQGTAIRIAQYQAVRARCLGSEQRLNGIFGICLVPVEEVLRVVENFVHVLFEERHGITDHPKIFVKGGPESLEDMEVPAFSINGRCKHSRGNKCLDTWVFRSLKLCPSRCAESHKLGLSQIDATHLFEELYVTGVGARPTAFDVVHPELIQLFSHAHHILYREVYVLSLCAVTERGVV